MKKQLFNLSLFYFASIIIASTLFVVLFRYITINNSVFFYKGLFILFITLLLTAIALIFIRRLYKNLTYKDILLILSLVFSFNLVFFTLFPTTIERSISVFMLNDLKSEKNIEQINQDFIKIYLQENKAIDKRLNEQLISGNIEKIGNSYKLTQQGEKVLVLFNFVAKVFLINQKLR